MSAESAEAGKVPDLALLQVEGFIRAMPSLEQRVGLGIRKALDEVIDGPRTGRYSVEQLEKTEKTYIGTKVEIVLRTELALERGRVLDNLICEHEVDTKFSLRGNWMIPSEAIDQLCLVVEAEDKTSRFSLGLIRATRDVLRPSKNNDKKHSLSAHGKSFIKWIVAKGSFPPNILLNLTVAERERILSKPSGKQRVKELFLVVTGKKIPREVVAQVAQQKDPMRRARDMKRILEPLGYTVLCATYEADRINARQLGFPDFTGDDWLSVQRSEGSTSGQ